ncbi:hypothetical protein HK405_004339 [Cladochytrium tenue]|nr:hypothetical protein HK405_004339 [Cladochytrium tenue]
MVAQTLILNKQSDVDTLKAEIGNLVEHNHDLSREMVELRKERSNWKDTQKQAQKLEHVVTTLHSEVVVLQQETTRLRRQNEDLEKQLETEITDSVDARRLWAEKESSLLNQLKAERSKVKELRALDAVKHEPGFDHDDAEALARGRPVRRNSNPVPIDTSLQEENDRLLRNIVELTNRLRERDMVIERQEQDILELQRTVSALMDDIEHGQVQAQFDMLGETTPPPSPSEDTSKRSAEKRLSIEFAVPAVQMPPAPSSPKKNRKRSKSGSKMSKSPSNNPLLAVQATRQPPSPSSPQGPTTLTPMKSFHSLAEELLKIGEKAPVEGGSLKGRMAALGLNTDGNREVLKKRLHKYIARKKRQAEAAALGLLA